MSPRPQPGDALGGRPPRPAAPGSGGPGRRRGAPDFPHDRDEHSLAWQLWNFRALFPQAGLADLRAVRCDQQSILAREREALVGLWSGDTDLLSPGRTYLAQRPELATGITVSLHTGPYQLLAEPWLHAGHEPLVLLNSQALEGFLLAVPPFQKRLGHRTRVRWAAVGQPGFMRLVVHAIRAGQPVLAYLDGNSGDDGMAGTRERGLRYSLPGRDILVRTGLARLAFRLACPLHRVALRWDDGGVAWDGAPSLRLGHDDDPAEVTRELFDWAFELIRARPAQWQYWTMLRDSAACFAGARLDEAAPTQSLRAEQRQAFERCCALAQDTARLFLVREVQVWWGDLLVDLDEDHFYPAAGLHDDDLDLLRDNRPTLREVRELHGEAWLQFHGLRLVLLGMARLGA